MPRLTRIFRSELARLWYFSWPFISMDKKLIKTLGEVCGGFIGDPRTPIRSAPPGLVPSILRRTAGDTGAEKR